MTYSISTWTIKELYDLFKSSKLNLSPLYQRNFIWSMDDQQSLVDSINRKIPIPNFFVLEGKNGKFEMVDGQQRSRTIISFINGGFPDLKNKNYSGKSHPHFLDFEFPITIITDIEDESIEKFYALVNKTGINLNKPEVRKADFYNTKLLKLVDEIASSKEFSSLKLFTETTLKRMNDREFVSELIVLLKDGHVDKKGLLDDYFEKDISSQAAAQLKKKFDDIIDKMLVINKCYPINKTRYKQRNDFYTLFDFIMNYDDYNKKEMIYFYKVLVSIGGDIKPTQEECESLQDYARNCVTQSNSKLARENRLNFFSSLLKNKAAKPNEIQKDLMSFYGFKSKKLIHLNTYNTLDISQISTDEKIAFK